MKDFKDKIVVITGAGSGIGRALAIAFANEGAKLALNEIKNSSLNETIKLLPKSTDYYTEIFDVASKEAHYYFATNVIDHFGQVDIVINNAGVAISKFRADEVPQEDYDWIIGVNFWGMFHSSLAFLPHLRKRKESCLVNISSVFGLIGIPEQTPYCITKFAIRGFSESLYAEEKFNNTGVHVCSVHPGGIKTNIARASRGAGNDEVSIKKFEKAFINTPTYAARVIQKGIRRKKQKVLIGRDAIALNFIIKLPRFLSDYLLSKMYKKIGK